MPPVPTPVLPPHRASRSRARMSSMLSSRGMDAGSGLVSGFSASTPPVDVRLTNRSPSTGLSSRLASASLSPNLSSCTATVSFSLTTGMTPQSSNCVNVWRAFMKRSRLRRSSRVSSTCAQTSPCAAKASSYSRIRRPCPTAAAPCLPGRPSTRCSPTERAARPAATAPELTSVTRRPSWTNADSCSARLRSTGMFRPSGVVSTALPTLTTRERARARRSSRSSREYGQFIPAPTPLQFPEIPRLPLPPPQNAPEPHADPAHPGVSTVQPSVLPALPHPWRK